MPQCRLCFCTFSASWQLWPPGCVRVFALQNSVPVPTSNGAHTATSTNSYTPTKRLFQCFEFYNSKIHVLINFIRKGESRLKITSHGAREQWEKTTGKHRPAPPPPQPQLQGCLLVPGAQTLTKRTQSGNSQKPQQRLVTSYRGQVSNLTFIKGDIFRAL